MKLCSAPHRGRKELVDKTAMERDSSVGPMNPRHRHKKVEIVIPTVMKRLPTSVITVNSSGSEEGNVGGKKVSWNTAPLIVSDDEQVLPTRKHKAKSQQSTHTMKRVASSPDPNTTHCSSPKAVKSLTQTTKRTQFQIKLPLDSELSGEESLDGRTAAPMPVQNIRADSPKNAPSSKVPIKPQQPSKELHPEQCKSSFICYPYLITFYIILAMEVQSPPQLKEYWPVSMPSCDGGRLPSMPSQELSGDECKSWITFKFTSYQIEPPQQCNQNKLCLRSQMLV